MLTIKRPALTNRDSAAKKKKTTAVPTTAEEETHSNNEVDDDDNDGEEEDDEVDDDDDDEEEVKETGKKSNDVGEDETTTNKKKRKFKNRKRIVGTPSISIKQMKDAVVRIQAAITSSKVSNLQAMTTYGTEKQTANNPRSLTVLINYDEIVTRPDRIGEGERVRDKPMWTFLLPQDLDKIDFVAELEKVCKAIREEEDRPIPIMRGLMKKKTPVVVENDFDFSVVRNQKEYLHSIYGPSSSSVCTGSAVTKKARKEEHHDGKA